MEKSKYLVINGRLTRKGKLMAMYQGRLRKPHGSSHKDVRGGFFSGNKSARERMD